MPQPIGTPAAPPADSMAQALDDYLAAVEVGTAPPRDEFLARYPDLAEELDACLVALRFIGRAAAGPRSVAAEVAEAPPPEHATGRLGDFRIVREVGRGGMGVVYEAEQISLGRRVALKVLPFAATMDPRQLQRFHNEVRAAASLDHPHIVHVHAVGCERAVHFYAMQFIEGQTLAELIADLRQGGGRPADDEEQPTTPHAPGQPAPPAAATAARAAASTERAPRDRAHFRRVAELGIQAAEALDHAHALGIVHRDVKPANLLLDGRGGLWVTDFGLAHVQSDARLTMTGDLVGTLRYMSPEQAFVKRVVVDHRTDVYSLGATLYELLTLEPAFAGNDRQELLRQIAFEEPVRPRRLSRAVPAELETIVLKAMEKNPADRYATAQELADDLRRFLEDKPIKARPAGLGRRLRKWGRRHPAVVAALTAAVAVLAVGLGWVAGDRAARRADAEGRVTEALAVAEAKLPQGNPRDPELITAARKAEAQLVGGVVGVELRKRVEQVLADLAMLAALEQIRLDQAVVKENKFHTSGADPAYALAFRQYGIDIEALPVQEAAARIRQRAIGLHLAAALDDWAVCRRPREKKEAIRGNRPPEKGLLWQKLLQVAQAADPDEWRCSLRAALATGKAENATLQKLAASAPVEKLKPVTLVLLGRFLSDRRAAPLAVGMLRKAQRLHPGDFWINQDLGRLLTEIKPPQLEEAIGFYRAALALRFDSPGVHLNLGLAFQRKGRLDDAVASYKEAIRLKKDYAMAYDNLGNALREQQKWPEAVAALQKAIDLQPNYAGAYSNFGSALVVQRKWPEAVAAFQKAIDLQPDFATAHFNLGNALAGQQKFPEAVMAYQKAIDLQPDFAHAYHNLGNALLIQRKWPEADAVYQKAIALRPDDAGAYSNFGLAMAYQRKLPAAEAAYRKAIDLNPNFADAYYNLGDVLDDQKKLPAAEAAFRKAIDLQPDHAKAYWMLGWMLQKQGKFAEAFDKMKRGRELGSRRPDWPVIWSAEWLRGVEQSVRLDPKLPRFLSGEIVPADAAERLLLANLCNSDFRQFYAASTRFFREAFAEQPALADGLSNYSRYNAARAAALAGCGQGKDAANLGPQEYARLRGQALAWLRADLAAFRKKLAKQPDAEGRRVRERMHFSQLNPAFAGVRDAAALAKLPEAERQQWQQFWADFAATLAQAGGQGDPKK